MKVGIENCTFAKVEGNHDIEYKGRIYKGVDINVQEDGYDCQECVTIVDKELEDALIANDDTGNYLDDCISYYCLPDEYIYDALESIMNEKIVGILE